MKRWEKELINQRAAYRRNRGGRIPKRQRAVEAGKLRATEVNYNRVEILQDVGKVRQAFSALDVSLAEFVRGVNAQRRKHDDPGKYLMTIESEAAKVADQVAEVQRTWRYNVQNRVEKLG